MSDPGFVEIRRWPVRALLRADLVGAMGEWILAREVTLPPDATAFASGRGGARAFALPDGRRVVWREYRRGGWVGRWVRRTYAGFVARPFQEVVVTARARARGIPTAEVLGARVIGRGVYRGAIVTAEIAGATPALDALRSVTGRETANAIAGAVGRAVGSAHAHGLAHADLNCNNLLVAERPEGWQAWVIDLDRARLVRPPLATRERAGALARLARSARKLDPAGTAITPGLRAAFRAAYEEAAGEPCGC